MFQYTTETIINSNEGNLNGGKRFGFLKAGEDVEISVDTKSDFFIVDGVNSFKPEFIKAIYHSPYRESVKAQATLDLSSFAAGDVVNVTVVLKEIGSTRSTIQNAYKLRTKPFHYELEVKDATKVAKEFANLISRDMRDTDFGYFKAAGTTTTLTLDADDCYLQFESVTAAKVLDLNDASCPLPAKLLGAPATTGLVPGVIVRRGDQGAGTVARLIKDLRIPTSASINPFGTDHGGMPIPGGKYHQYTIEYETPRAHVSGTVVGSVGEVSRTTHVFFVEDALAKTGGDWQKAMAALGVKVTEAGRTPVDQPNNAFLGTKNDNLILEGEDKKKEAKLNATDKRAGSVQ